MAYFYLDTEETGLNPETDKIITIQYQRLDYHGSKPVSELVILKEWESSEEEIVRKFHDILFTKSVFDFIPLMTNAPFDFRFLFEKFKKYNLPTPTIEDFYYSKPLIDIKPILIMINNMEFSGWGLNNLTDKKTDGSLIPKLYEQKKFKEIEEYIKQETESFLFALKIIQQTLKGLNLKDDKFR